MRLWLWFKLNRSGEVKEIVTKHIRGLENVKATLTLTLFEHQAT
jgi:hypothetical protein